ncbi:hypothetical protein [Peribacillus sp. NPDC097295]|uniref:hypothetical protein n=1 Tax=Peribacillus sp. NPDC097295 TaxID=3364402 RepID=UPI0037F5B497
MNRSDRFKKRRWTLYIAITIFALILFLGTWNQIAKNKNTFVPAGGTSNDSNQMITIELPDGNVMTTDKKNIYYKDDKMYYKSKYDEIDITGAKITDETN